MYFDSVVLFLRPPHDQIDRVKQFLPLLQNAGVALKLEKVTFLTRTVDYIDNIIRFRRPDIATLTTDAIKERKPSTNVIELRSFLRISNLFRYSTPIFVRRAAPLNNKWKENQPKYFGVLTTEELSAMH